MARHCICKHQLVKGLRQLTQKGIPPILNRQTDLWTVLVQEKNVEWFRPIKCGLVTWRPQWRPLVAAQRVSYMRIIPTHNQRKVSISLFGKLTECLFQLSGGQCIVATFRAYSFTCIWVRSTAAILRANQGGKTRESHRERHYLCNDLLKAFIFVYLFIYVST